MTDFGVRLRMALAYANISYRDLGDELGVSAMAVSKWAQGQCYPRSSHLIKISERCGCPINWLMEPGDPFTGQDRIDAIRNELKDAYARLEQFKDIIP